jgi:hypothetical protein
MTAYVSSPAIKLHNGRTNYVLFISIYYLEYSA